MAASRGVPVIAFVGAIADDALVPPAGVTHVFPIVPRPCSVEEAMAHAPQFLHAAVKRVMALILNEGVACP
jgi:glycerate kinase